ncbi:hypothetical protein CEXT_727271 [Caerostris extrusa]|uniref:Uncharacterized protein n=1 Tax=Caerostris extrusa TaxID=172846 RepID=A0AAV4X8A1_CAEEX|nr:hypothetical protein CEXT_727271 [Caerostris extrusa]
MKGLRYDSSSNETLLAIFAACIFMEAKRYKMGLYGDDARPIKSAMHTRDIQDTHISRAIHLRIFLSTRTYPLKRNGKKRSQQELKTELQYHFFAQKKEVAPTFQKSIPPLQP